MLQTHNQEWRKDLKAGDQIDVYVKADERGKVFGWMQGNIDQVYGDALAISFPKSTINYDCRVDRWSTDLMPFETKTKDDYAWRNQFLENASMFECDVHDKSTWSKATILEVKKKTENSGRVVLLAYCALRVYRNDPNS